MAKTPEAASPQPTKPPETAEKSGMPMKKLLIFGIPVFVVQLVVVYFVITKVLAPSPVQSAEQAAAATKGHGSEAENGAAVEASIYIVKDIIVNPAGTNGTRFLLTTVGFEVTTPEAKKELEAKDVQVRDVLNTVLTGKDLVTLSMVEQREPLRQEIAKKVGGLLRSGDLTNVYFSKFIIQ